MKRVLHTGFLTLALAMVAGGCATNDDATPGGMGDRPNGAECDARGECASGICNVTVCQAQVNGMGLANGGTARHTGVRERLLHQRQLSGDAGRDGHQPPHRHALHRLRAVLLQPLRQQHVPRPGDARRRHRRRR